MELLENSSTLLFVLVGVGISEAESTITSHVVNVEDCMFGER